MPGEDKLLMTLEMIGLDLSQKKREISDWLILIRLLFQPTFFRLDDHGEEAFDLETIRNGMLEESEEEKWLIVGNEKNECSCHYANHSLIIKNVLDKQTYSTYQSLISDYLRTKMQVRGLFAYVRSYDEFVYHNTEDLEIRSLFEKKEATDQLPKMLDSDGKIIVDCNQFSGYDLFYRGLCLTACWEMYYSKQYYQIIPKDVFLDVQQVDEIEELPNEVIRIRLYQDPLNWKNERNVQFQRYYRDQLGMDHLAWDNGVGILKEPFIEYAYSDQTVQTVQYQNKKMQPTTKKEACFFVTRVYDVVRNNSRERRVKGHLNAQAFFPWIDEQSLRMMTYKVLNPEVALDHGLAAYDYYIRDLLEIDIQDEKYEEYTAILRIYIPDDALKHIPIDAIKQSLKDVKMSRVRKRKKMVRFDLKKNENHLRVVFMGYQQLYHLAEL